MGLGVWIVPWAHPSLHEMVCKGNTENPARGQSANIGQSMWSRCERPPAGVGQRVTSLTCAEVFVCKA